jgi:UDP-N-acetylmuramoyl-tripeptide--D-alanyl-D-alanine ligase
MSIEGLHELFLRSAGITTDTRNLLQDGMFFAIKGDNFDGNAYALKALEQGCKYAVVSDQNLKDEEGCVFVADTLKALQNLANFHRKKFDIPVIGITGSNGKTTTKELLGAVLSRKYAILITQGNLNNHLGVPFTLLKMSHEHEVAIIEMGANKPGDIKELVEIAEPTHGIITNIGAAHLEGFGSLEGVIQTKKELYDFIEHSGGHLFYHADDAVLKNVLPNIDAVTTYGQRNGHITGTLVDQDPYVRFRWKEGAYESPLLETNLVGQYNFVNFLSAICIGRYFDVDAKDINEAIEAYTPTNNRSQIMKTGHNTLVVDCYNANVTSMNAALSSFVAMSGKDKLAILGDMRELGEVSKLEHEKVISFLVKNNLRAILVGKEMKLANSVGLPHYNSTTELLDSGILDKEKDKLILLKGSRGIQLEKLLPVL